MAIKDHKESLSNEFRNIIKEMHFLLDNISLDLHKAEHGNKAASQRVRTGTVRLEKIAKMYRKESVHHEKKSSKRSSTKSASSKAKKPAAKTMSRTKAKTTSKAKSASKAKSISAKPRHFAFKRSTAKLPQKRMGW